MKGIISNIQRFSLNDGPGIRTTVFFKGCNLNCAWCHNPETIDIKPVMMTYPENCVNCGECDKGCFSGAKVICGDEISSDEVFGHISRDIPYYANSGGGVTVSGGEVLVQPGFAKEILELCKCHGIHTAIESNMHADWDVINALLPYTDLVMADVKHIDPDVHLRYTGASNELILDNIKLLDKIGIPIIIRTPVIPGVNDGEEVIGAIGKFAKGLKNVLYYELLNFNPLGAGKYVGLGKENIFKETKPLSNGRVKYLSASVSEHGIEVRNR